MLDLPDIIGQDAAMASVQRAMAAARMPHALLFIGPHGVGRQTTAAALAKVLLCDSPPVAPNAGRLGSLEEQAPLRLACNACESCRMMNAGTHGDFHLVYKELAAYHDNPRVRERLAQELGIPVIQQFLLAPCGRQSAHGRGKVFLVLEAELMNEEAANALLKTLEEPPAGVTIILISTSAEELLPTILSRCWTVRFSLLPQEFVRRCLMEREVAAPEAAAFYAAFTGGSVGYALELAGLNVHALWRQMLPQIAALNEAGDAELGEQLVKHMEKLAEDIIRSDQRPLGSEMAKTLANRHAAGIMLQLIAGAYLDAMHLLSGEAGKVRLVNTDGASSVQALAKKFSATQLAEIVEQLAQLEQLLWRNVNPKIVWDNAVITCASAAPLL